MIFLENWRFLAYELVMAVWKNEEALRRLELMFSVK